MLRALSLTAAVWLILGSAPAAQPRKIYPPAGDCNDDRMVDRCRPEQQQRVRDLFGVKSIEAHRDAGDQVRRAFYVDGYGRDVVAIAFVRPKGSDPQLWVHFPRGSDGRRSEPLRSAVPLAVWNGLLERSAHFDRRLAPLPSERGKAKGEDLVLCMHSWVYTVEATDPAESEHRPAQVRRATEDACDDGLAEAYATELKRAALPLLPPCARLDPRQHREEATLLAACSMLEGDRLAAAEVLNLAMPFRHFQNAAELDGLFQHDATVDWNGERNADRGGAQSFWVAKVTADGRSRFYFDRIEGRGPGEVVVRGMLYRMVAVPEGDPEIEEMARVEQLWTDDRGDLAVKRISVGPFERRP